MSTITLAILITSVFATSVLSGIFGMAGGLVLMGIVVSFVSVGQAMAVHGFAQLIANGTRAIGLWRHIKFGTVGVYAIGFSAAALLMWFISFNPPRWMVYLGLGIIPFITFLPKTPRLDFLKPRDALICGFVVTVAHMTAGVSGPILDMFFVRSKMDRFEMIGTKALTQVMGHLLKIAYFGAFLSRPSEVFQGFPSWMPIAIVVSSVLGTRVGGKILTQMSESMFRFYLRLIFLVVGSIYLLMAARELIPS